MTYLKALREDAVAQNIPNKRIGVAEDMAAAAIYLCISFALVGLFKLAEGRYLAYLAPRRH